MSNSIHHMLVTNNVKSYYYIRVYGIILEYLVKYIIIRGFLRSTLLILLVYWFEAVTTFITAYMLYALHAYALSIVC